MNPSIFRAVFLLSFLLAYACNTQKNTDTTKTTVDAPVYIENALIVQLKDRATPRQLTDEYRHYNLKMDKAISRATNLWLFTYDTSTIEPPKMLKIIKDSPYVTEAEFDKVIELRNPRQ